MNSVANHLWQSTVFAAAVALAAWALRRHSARLRYWLWLAASVKFLIPFSLLVSIGGRVMKPEGTPVFTAMTVMRVSNYFAPVSPSALPAITRAATPASLPVSWGVACGTIWVAVVLMLMTRWFLRWYRIQRLKHNARPLFLETALPVLSVSSSMEPGMFGLFRPVLLVPEGLPESLTHGQFHAILEHELCHARYRDNLTAALHMCVETLFWFHPAVWWIGARLIEERERACDESVLKRGNGAAEYAQGIVNVCREYVESPLPCAAGVTGADLKKRVREIMTWRGSPRLSFARKCALVAAGVVAAGIPLAIGIVRAQTLPPPPAYNYEVVSIHPTKPGREGSYIRPGPGGGLSAENVTAMNLLTFAYHIHEYQIGDAPAWMTSARFDVTFTPDKTDVPPAKGAALKEIEGFISRNAQRTQAVLRDRFGLVLRAETREMPIYALVVAKGGPKLSPAASGGRGPSMMGNGQGNFTAKGASLKMLADSLAGSLRRLVTDETGLEGVYDFKLEYTPDTVAPPADVPAASDLGSIFTALTEQLGLRLESRKGPVQVYVVEKIEKPSEN